MSSPTFATGASTCSARSRAGRGIHGPSDRSQRRRGFVVHCRRVGGVQCWGDNFRGQLGDGTRNYRREPGYVVGLQQGVRQVAMGGGSACAMLVSGAVECWGTNYAGQLGTGDRGDSNTPKPTLLDYVLVPKDVVEYYNAALDHYFMTLLDVEVAALDGGVFSGWARTSLSFKAWPLAADATSPVCRFYMPPARGDSHFYSASPGECDDVRGRFPDFDLESSEVMYIALPDLRHRCVHAVHRAGLPTVECARGFEPSLHDRSSRQGRDDCARLHSGRLWSGPGHHVRAALKRTRRICAR